jgi:Rrf2 family protein
MVDLRFASSLHMLIAMGFKAKGGDELVTSNELAESLGTNPALVRKLLVPLAQKGLIETFKGKTGGARLAKLPKDISLRQIYEASVDKEIACTRETTDHDCPVGSCIEKVFKKIVDGMEESISSHLEKTTLQQVMNQIK